MDAETFEAIVERLRKQGTDDGEFEVKESAVKLSSDIWETVSAFANTTGGVIILRLSERNDFTPVDNFDRAAVEGASEADFGKTLIARTFDRAYDLAPRYMKGADNNWERLERLNFIDEKGHVTKAGLLAAGSYLQQFFPRLVVDVEVHPRAREGHARGTALHRPNRLRRHDRRDGRGRGCRHRQEPAQAVHCRWRQQNR
ncbi:hypothetical protein [Paratractidigestivibacter sp.]|uniref:AlbA family DNA-binding domain-containing protein n=1 Tax=Paratractidigestivibacter sp. TaxID=2847316 RepID=UPI002AC933C8|nr:hypothetical protein [Paratractidigestivibacter sp.]